MRLATDTELNYAFDEVVARLRLNPQVIDDHGGGRHHITLGTATWQLGRFTLRGRVYAVPLHLSGMFCINPLYVDARGQVHLDATPLEGFVYVLNPRDVPGSCLGTEGRLELVKL